ncbi:MAG: 3-ketoacyl-ACP reductase [Ruminococcaceae bacterium]|nr:3-ketoacyl-ACP reductase [Oscillospiraceae bacterium]
MKKLAVITGARRGIGLGIAKALGDEGYRLLICATSDEAPETLEALSAYEVEYMRCNIADAADRDRLLDRAEAYGRIDVLVNNAGVAPKVRLDILETTEESFERLMDINLEGTFFMCQNAANRMIAMQNRGIEDYRPRIVNISSISAYTSSVSRGEYCISKAGIAMVTQLFADRLAEYGIPVFEVRPGIIRTDMTAAVTEKYEKLIAEGLLPIARMGTPEDVAGCVVAACSGKLDYTTGQVLNADGGFALRRL